tara:strand:- start:218 stop:631 length:414 start_codon:yes stop_codon:yes gene_type:complete
MDWSIAIGIGQLLIGGGLVAAILLHWRELPKSRAQARKIEAEAEHIDSTVIDATVQRLGAEVERMAKRLTALEKENEALRERIDRQGSRERKLQQENDQLRDQVVALETRLAALENLFRTQPLTAEMQEALEKLEAN